MAENNTNEVEPGAVPDAGGDTAAGGAEDPTVQLEGALAQVAELKDQALRAAAEAENVRRRSAREVENAHKFALEKFVAGLLPVIDSLDKAVEAVETTDTEDGAAAAVAEGVELSRKLFIDTLAKFGVERIDPHGEPFDPQQHEAMSMVEAPDVEPNTVIQVLAPGYSLNGRLVRAAMAPETPPSIDETV